MPGSYVFTVACDGFLPQTGPVDLEADQTREFTLSPSVFTVKTEPGAAVAIRKDGKEIRAGKADDKGSFSASGLTGGHYTVEASLAGKKTRLEEVSFPGNRTETLPFRLDALPPVVKTHRLTLKIHPAEAQVLLRDEKGNEIAPSSRAGGVRAYELREGLYL